MEVNRYNVEAISLLYKDRAAEADVHPAEGAQSLTRKNPFTLNNLGFAREQEGEYDSALQYYTAAANLGSTENIQVAANKEWRGRPISEIASRNAPRAGKADGARRDSRSAGGAPDSSRACSP